MNSYQPNNNINQQPQLPPSQNAITNDSVMAILQALGNLNLNQNVPQNNVNNNNGYQNMNSQRPRQPRGPATCYKCRQPGHIARNCPTNQQLPVNNIGNPPPQPAVQAFAQQISLQPMINQPQVQQQQPQVFQMPQYQPPPQQQMAPQNNNIPQQQNNTGGNVFVATGNIPQQMPQAQVYPVQHLNENTHP